MAGGFARNFLLPEGRAIVATDGVEGQAAADAPGPRPARGQGPEAAEAQATVLAGAVIPITARAAGGGRLFGSIGPADVAEAILATKGVEVDRRHIVLPEHIKEIGELRRDRGAVRRRRHRGDRGGQRRQLSGRSRARYPPGSASQPGSHVVQWSRVHDTGGPDVVRARACHIVPRVQLCARRLMHRRPRLSTGTARYTDVLRNKHDLSTPFGALAVPRQRSVRVRGAVVQAFDDTRPRPLRAAPPAPSGRGSPRTTSRRRSRCSGRCSCPTTRRRSGIEQCSAQDFYKPAHGHIFGAIRALIERGEAIDAVTVTDELQALGSARGDRATAPSSSRCWPTRRRSPTPGTTPRSSRSTRCCASSSAWRARSPTSATRCPRT